ncbi:glycosyltransferase [candidate division KSB1 bacterium]|nr:glycosyltransferase [candidate division KSB1 bacterium]RQW10487.1 MAG: glycosyltransferase [candidate division KSB1 bacterium]
MNSYSIIVPVYFNEGELDKTFSELKEKVIDKNPELEGEIIFIDDGSKDKSFHELLEIFKLHPGLVKVIKLTRNFGQASATLAGYNHSKSQCVINISADLQDPPELINEMLKFHFNENYQIVICTREGRDESFIRIFTSKIFYWLMKVLCFANMPIGGFDYALLGKIVKDTIFAKAEANFSWQGSILWSGFSIKFIPYKRRERLVGKSRWTLAKKIKTLIDGVLNYSFFPIRLMSITGIIVATLGFIYAIWIVVAWFYGDVPFTGWAPIMILLLVLSGFQMLMLGIIGEYLWRALDQVRNRPQYIIEKIYE